MLSAAVVTGALRVNVFLTCVQYGLIAPQADDGCKTGFFLPPKQPKPNLQDELTITNN